MKIAGASASLVLLLQWISPFPARAADAKATALLLQSLAAQGGEAKLRALKSVQWEAAGYRNELEQSERPEGPYITEFLSINEVHDIAGHRLRRAIDTSVYPVYKATTLLVVDGDLAMQANGGSPMPGTPEQVKLARERMALSPERLLLTALDATDVHTEPDVVLQSVSQNVIAFTLDGAPVQIFLNAYTHLPTAMDYSGPLAHASYWGFLGDVTQRTYYGEWWLAKGGIHLPVQINIEGNGRLDQVLVIRKLELDSPLNEARI
jgi:hypothetical protein